MSPAEAERLQREADAYVQVITAGEEPFQIVWASEAWLRLCEYTPPQVLGHTLELIQGAMTDRVAVNSLMNAIRRGEPIALSMINHTRTGKPFSHTLRVEPLRDSRGHVQCFQATSSNIDTSIATAGNAASSNPLGQPPSLSHPASRTVSNNLLVSSLAASPPPNLGSPSPDGDDGGMRRSESAMSISGMLPRCARPPCLAPTLPRTHSASHPPCPKPQVFASRPLCSPPSRRVGALQDGVGAADLRHARPL